LHAAVKVWCQLQRGEVTVLLEMVDSGDENTAATSSFNSNLKMKHRYDVRFKLAALACAKKYSGEKEAKQFGVDRQPPNS
jgi:hypothetical protein